MDRKRILNSIYAATFFFTIHYAFLLYIGSSFLGTFFSSALSGRFVSTVYTVAALLSIWLVVKAPKLFRRLTLARTTQLFLVLLGIVTFVLAVTHDPMIALACFVVLIALQITLRYILDVYIEKFSRDETTGTMRGMFMTIINTAIAISPIIVGYLLTSTSFSTIYFIAGSMILIVLAILGTRLREIPESKYHDAPFLLTWRKMLRRPNLTRIFAINVVLEIFYTWMVIYTPLYLTQNLGFTWEQVGFIFTIMLIPFVIIEVPAGYLADTRFGEKEMLTLGLGIMALTTAALAYLTSSNIFLWTLFLFGTRIGASFVEIMTDTYFFKKVAVEDTDLIGLYRSSRPLATLVAPPIAAIILTAGTYQTLYLALGLLLFYSMRYSLALEDTL